MWKFCFLRCINFRNAKWVEHSSRLLSAFIIAPLCILSTQSLMSFNVTPPSQGVPCIHRNILMNLNRSVLFTFPCQIESWFQGRNETLSCVRKQTLDSHPFNTAQLFSSAPRSPPEVKWAGSLGKNGYVQMKGKNSVWGMEVLFLTFTRPAGSEETSKGCKGLKKPTGKDLRSSSPHRTRTT